VLYHLFSLAQRLTRVETKIFVFVFSRKFRKKYFVVTFREKSLRKVTKITKVFANTFAKTKIFVKNDAGSENATKYPNSKRQMKFRS
jgi:hypothetical protein